MKGGDEVALGDTRFQVLETGGHTLGHISYHDAADRTAFVGDTLFALGCGRLFEGTPAMMWDSLQRLAALPDETTVYLRPRIHRLQRPLRPDAGQGRGACGEGAGGVRRP